MALKEVTITEFKAKCHGIIEQVRKTRRPIRVTRFGKPLAEILPTSPKKRRPAGSVTRKEGLWET